MSLCLMSSAFDNQGNIPHKYTCTGDDISPPLSWENIPANTKSLVLIVDDPDAPDPKAPKMTWVHWVLYNLPPEETQLKEGASSGNLPAAANEGVNDWNKTGYGGPCPPIGNHRYFFKLYALDILLPEKPKASKADIESAMQNHIIEKTELIGFYEKQFKK